MSETEGKDGAITERDLHAGILCGSGEVGGKGRAIGGCGGEAAVGTEEQSVELGQGIEGRQSGESCARPEERGRR